MKESGINLKLVGERIKQLRKELGFTQEELAEKLKINFGLETTRETIGKWEGGKQEMGIYALTCIAKALGVTTSYLTREKNHSDDVAELLETLHKRPEMRVLFDVSRNASKEDIEKVIKIIEVLKENR